MCEFSVSNSCIGPESWFDERSNSNIIGEVNKDVGISPADRVKMVTLYHRIVKTQTPYSVEESTNPKLEEMLRRLRLNI